MFSKIKSLMTRTFQTKPIPHQLLVRPNIVVPVSEKLARKAREYNIWQLARFIRRGNVSTRIYAGRMKHADTAEGAAIEAARLRNQLAIQNLLLSEVAKRLLRGGLNRVNVNA